MKLLDRLFRKRPPVGNAKELADFIDEQSAFIVQKGIFEYSRARAGHYAKVMFAEEAFIASADRSRWSAYPLGLAMVGEMVEGVLRHQAGEHRRLVLDRLVDLVLSVFDRYPVPSSIDAATWRAMRDELAKQLYLVGTHAPKRVIDIPDSRAEAYFALMPIHEKMRTRDFPTTRNYLRINLCNIHDELQQRANVPAIVEELLSMPP